MDLFDQTSPSVTAPLATRMRPRTLDEFVGQVHLVGPGSLLRSAVETGRVGSLVLYGPAGTGKSTLARILARATSCHFIEFSATASGVKEIRDSAEEARNQRRLYDRGTIVFCDEIHRLNKGQQDAFLPYVENGVFALIGATTENPYFEVNAPLLSRCTVVRLEPLTDEQIDTIVEGALSDAERGLGGLDVELAPDARALIVDAAAGDARRALSALEQSAMLAAASGEGRIAVSRELAGRAVQQRLVLYDKAGQAHYDVISAFIKSIRGSDPDAAVFWLAYMLEAGENPRFIARRLVIAAAEDIGNADPMGLVLATAAAQAVELVGLPEGQIPLAQATIYLACAEKSNRANEAIGAAREAAREAGRPEVPTHLMDIRHADQQRAGLGVGYQYPHGSPGAFVEQQYLPETQRDARFYHPSFRGRERRMAERLARLWGDRFGGPPPTVEGGTDPGG